MRIPPNKTPGFSLKYSARSFVLVGREYCRKNKKHSNPRYQA